METIRLKTGRLNLTAKSNDNMYMEGVCKIFMDIVDNGMPHFNIPKNILILINSHQSCNEFVIKSFNGESRLNKYDSVIFVVPEDSKIILRGLLRSQVCFIDINKSVKDFYNILYNHINNPRNPVEIERLTNIEKHIIFLIGTKKSKEQICKLLKMKDLTLNVHLCNLKKKLFVKKFSDLLIKCEIYLYVSAIIPNDVSC